MAVDVFFHAVCLFIRYAVFIFPSPRALWVQRSSFLSVMSVIFTARPLAQGLMISSSRAVWAND
jgi:hypothetical protein